jgi:mutator protein MutT
VSTPAFARRLIAVVLIEHEGRYLFIRQSKTDGAYPGTLHIPGGGIEDGENPEEAARREVREEVGLELADLKRTGFGWDTMQYKGQLTQLVFLRFTGTATSADFTVGDDAASALWIPRDELHSVEHNASSKDFLTHLGLI